jgi:hypothetical protein
MQLYEHARQYGSASCTAMGYDGFYEQLWTGYQDGRITSFLHPEFSKLVSFPAHKLSVVAVMPMEM